MWNQLIQFLISRFSVAFPKHRLVAHLRHLGSHLAPFRPNVFLKLGRFGHGSSFAQLSAPLGLIFNSLPFWPAFRPFLRQKLRCKFFAALQTTQFDLRLALQIVSIQEDRLAEVDAGLSSSGPIISEQVHLLPVPLFRSQHRPVSLRSLSLAEHSG